MSQQPIYEKVYQNIRTRDNEDNIQKNIQNDEINKENEETKKIKETKWHKSNEIQQKQMSTIDNDITKEGNGEQRKDISGREIKQEYYNFEKYKDILLRISILIKTIQPMANSEIVNRLSNLIIHNLIMYGRNVEEWRDIEDFRELDIGVIQRNIINQIVSTHRKHEVIIKAIFVDKVKRIITRIKEGNVSIEEIYKYPLIGTEWGCAFDIALCNEIVHKGNEMYYEYLNNPIISYYLMYQFGAVDKQKQIEIIKTRINFLMMLFNM
ncbi:hypothetical protein KM1_045920 [Entamoeba histolytica HM-3:IMSS]|uniref:Uncharacterized protein n=4 Tax=Entamoeba histolytica TaxID=5759 RepID=C4M4J8_ENTH1|nr:hypothetical protein EHI_138920 [Entamoeba histolytica HM-1:IMSS]EAL46251.1 hypothetical protein EHI_138920 [Entamoeba histolytica HM-1:IMSS]EMS14855.1 hypothetical protein KM1_045920 [Entamoeba histolytica HM-3:IMSS]ENY64745.1 hypothetical protein EHI7A_019870 [Entamoeba histolytica HM-1:IMSS-A]GAT96287.1 hypothetical protein CL6EHI_138920 [Entamoeba histolytica]|eukprot:XP_651640.1 hypothetical protein EHI_138920 [Entamoeba histolytica HM-1:IMSS]